MSDVNRADDIALQRAFNSPGKIEYSSTENVEQL